MLHSWQRYKFNLCIDFGKLPSIKHLKAALFDTLAKDQFIKLTNGQIVESLSVGSAHRVKTKN